MFDGYGNHLFVVWNASGDDQRTGDHLDALDSERAGERDDRSVLQLHNGGGGVERWSCGAVLV